MRSAPVPLNYVVSELYPTNQMYMHCVVLFGMSLFDHHLNSVKGSYSL